jgi:hypothetical protein
MFCVPRERCSIIIVRFISHNRVLVEPGRSSAQLEMEILAVTGRQDPTRRPILASPVRSSTSNLKRFALFAALSSASKARLVLGTSGRVAMML